MIVISCNESKNTSIPFPEDSPSLLVAQPLSEDILHDKILGGLVGSAIGDAMGASTEMWYRGDIQSQYGYIKGLTDATRVKSPEGTWRDNMIAGATTDDTRWKFLMGQYFKESKNPRDGNTFADFIVSYYQSQITGMDSQANKGSTDEFDKSVDQINWIKEWARVALAYRKGGRELEIAKSSFYGGEMSCAGMLYAPMFGLVGSDPATSYVQAYDHAFFDVGYARDISALTAAMTSMAMHTPNIDSIINVIKFVDPYKYKNSRLIGRIAEQIVYSAQGIVMEGRSITEANDNIRVPVQFEGSKLEWSQLQHIYKALEKDQKSIAFHAGEIFQILIASLYYGDGDFTRTMQFIVNYGRDNDTVAAVAGMILGANVGFSNLPVELRNKVVEVNREVVGIDLLLLADRIVE